MNSRQDGPERLVVVSNRLPFQAAVDSKSKKTVLQPGGGGLVSALDPVLRRSGGLWIGWAGGGEAGSISEAAGTLPYGVVAVELSEEETAGFYHGFTNRTLWPLFHDLVERTVFEESWWKDYVTVNRKFAEATAAELRPGDLIWAHDFHLFLFARALRRLEPSARCALFLHTPFPPPQLFQRLPWRREIAVALLEFDLIGFQSERDFSAFARTISAFCPDARPIDFSEREAIWSRADRTARGGVFPISMDFAFWNDLGRNAKVISRAERFRAKNGNRQIILGVDRLDYSKGIPHRLRAFAALLERHPELREKVQFLQIAVPSRTSVAEYKDLKKEIDRLTGMINGTYGTTSWVPVNYLYRHFEPPELAAYYRAADVAMITSVKDGMNLVAKEFCAASVEGKGVLVLSEFAGAAYELAEGALIVNPHDTAGMREALYRALQMPLDEQRERLEAIRSYLETHDVHRWAADFLEVARGVGMRRKEPELLLAEWPGWKAPRLLLFVDYDGTLTGIQPHPIMAAPDRPLLELIDALAALDGVTLAIASGRAVEELERWFPNPRILLIAAHGAVWRRRGARALLLARKELSGLLGEAREQLEPLVMEAPGFLLEDKGHSFAIHYRLANESALQRFLPPLRKEIRWLLERRPELRLLEGRCVLELALASVTKGAALQAVRRELGLEGAPAAAFGDDRTDEDAFRVLGDSDLSVHVGAGPTVAEVALEGPAQVRELLGRLAAARLAASGEAETEAAASLRAE
jgi:trehalose 6-phosphate synthase/phosphatase